MIAYLDLPSGLSGDMLLGCLVDAGWPIAELRATIAALPLAQAEWAVEARQVMKGPMRATFVEVRAREGHVHRNLHDIGQIIAKGDIPDAVKTQALAVFTRLAEAEAKVHGTTPERIHFHEVGAVDAIIDVVGGIAGLAALHIDTLYASALPLGEGWATTAHGKIPLPAPATLELLAAKNAPTRPAPGAGEWVTPTAAAILAERATFTQPVLTMERIGIGAGRRDCAWPNVARLWVGQAHPGEAHPGAALPGGQLVQVETNLDDMNPQLYAAVTEAVFAAGALDVWLTPVQMKKGRPALVLAALVPGHLETVVCETILRQTTTLGVRVLPVTRRHEARRTFAHVATPWGTVHVKLKWLGHELLGLQPEYEDCLRLAQAQGVPLQEVLTAALAAGQQLRTSISAPSVDVGAMTHTHEAKAPSAHEHGPGHVQPHDHAYDHPHDHGHSHDHGHPHPH